MRVGARRSTRARATGASGAGAGLSAASAWTSRCRKRWSWASPRSCRWRRAAPSCAWRKSAPARRVEHWQNLVIAACEQCGRNRVPRCTQWSVLPDWLGSTPAHVRRAAPDPVARRRSCGCAICPLPSDVLLLAGPEGGLAPEELEMARHVRLSRRCGWALASCAPRPQLWRRLPRFMRCGGIFRYTDANDARTEGSKSDRRSMHLHRGLLGAICASFSIVPGVFGIAQPYTLVFSQPTGIAANGH